MRCVFTLKTSSDHKHCSDVNVISIATNSVFVSHNLGDVNVYGKSISHHQSPTSERKVRVVVFFSFLFPNGTLIDSGLQIVYLRKDNNLFSRPMNILQSV